MKRKKLHKFYALHRGPLDGDVVPFHNVPIRSVLKIQYGCAGEPLNLPEGMLWPYILTNRVAYAGKQKAALYARISKSNILVHVIEEDMEEETLDESLGLPS